VENIWLILFYSSFLGLIFLSLPLSLILFISRLAETSRTTFDFDGGESERVSGFDVEYCGGEFSIIILIEYASILLFRIIFLGSDLYSFLFYFKLIFIYFLFVWFRDTLPCFRYDKLMYLAWWRFLLLSLNFLLFFVGVRCFILFFFVIVY